MFLQSLRRRNWRKSPSPIFAIESRVCASKCRAPKTCRNWWKNGFRSEGKIWKRNKIITGVVAGVKWAKLVITGQNLEVQKPKIYFWRQYLKFSIYEIFARRIKKINWWVAVKIYLDKPAKTGWISVLKILEQG